LLAQGLLTGDNGMDIARSYFRANSIQRSNISAASFAQGLFPATMPINPPVPIHSYPLGQPDPVFDPIAANTVTLDTARAALEVAGIFRGPALASAYSGELALVRGALYGSAGNPPAGLIDPTSMPVPLTASAGNIQTANVINAGGIYTTLLVADPFVMEYCAGMPMRDVAWGQLSLSQISQLTRLIVLDFGIEMTPPYLNQVQSSNAAAHILRSMEQAATGKPVPGAFSAPGAKVLVINSSDTFVVGVAGLLHLHWLLPGYQPDYAAPGGSLVFELRQVKSNGDYIVRVYYTAQTFDQLRNLTPLSASQPPATMQLLVPNGSQSPNNLDVSFARFRQLLTKAIDSYYVQDPAVEVPPGVLTGVPLK
jgi:4-phytase/acid phosphatase